MSIVLKGLVALTGLLLLFLGVQWIFTPAAMAESLGLGLAGPQALNAARGSIGGPLLGNAVLCGLGLATGQGRYLIAAAVLIGTVFVGRVVGIGVDGPVASSVTAVVVEAVMIAALVATGRSMAKA